MARRAAWQSWGELSPRGRATEGYRLCFSFPPESVCGQQEGDLQGLGLSRYQNIFEAMRLSTDFLIISNPPATDADVCVITFVGSNPKLSSSRGMEGRGFWQASAQTSNKASSQQSGLKNLLKHGFKGN